MPPARPIFHRFAEDHHLVELLEAARDYIFSNFSEVVTEDEFLEVPRDILVSILQSEYLRIDSEFQASPGVVMWVVRGVVA